jgi:hypothetical protein
VEVVAFGGSWDVFFSSVFGVPSVPGGSVEVGFGGVWFRWVRLPYLYSVTYLVMV